jgi:hypothetical protein
MQLPKIPVMVLFYFLGKADQKTGTAKVTGTWLAPYGYILDDERVAEHEPEGTEGWCYTLINLN